MKHCQSIDIIEHVIQLRPHRLPTSADVALGKLRATFLWYSIAYLRAQIQNRCSQEHFLIHVHLRRSKPPADVPTPQNASFIAKTGGVGKEAYRQRKRGADTQTLGS